MLIRKSVLIALTLAMAACSRPMNDASPLAAMDWIGGIPDSLNEAYASITSRFHSDSSFAKGLKSTINLSFAKSLGSLSGLGSQSPSSGYFRGLMGGSRAGISVLDKRYGSVGAFLDSQSIDFSSLSRAEVSTANQVINAVANSDQGYMKQHAGDILQQAAVAIKLGLLTQAALKPISQFGLEKVTIKATETGGTSSGTKKATPSETIGGKDAAGQDITIEQAQKRSDYDTATSELNTEQKKLDDLQAELDQAKADLDAAKADTTKSENDKATAQANYDAAVAGRDREQITVDTAKTQQQTAYAQLANVGLVVTAAGVVLAAQSVMLQHSRETPPAPPPPPPSPSK